MFLYILSFILFIIIVKAVQKLRKDYAILAFCKRIKTVDGTPLEQSVGIAYDRSIFHNTFDLITSNAEDIFTHTRMNATQLKRSYVEYVLLTPIYNVIDPVDAEIVLHDNRLIKKGMMYHYLHPFIKTGLLTSSGKKWFQRRKMLTPAFHFNILGQFFEIFKNESEKFVKNLTQLCDSNEPKEMGLDNLISTFTLNTVCETALGVTLDDYADNVLYRQNLKKVEDSFIRRVVNPFLIDDWVYKTFSDGLKDQKYLEVLHAFSSGIIQKRREMLADILQKTDSNEGNSKEEETFYRKQRYAMLDTLLRAEKDGLIDHAGICEEVDTFIFEGFDTTSMNLMFTLMNMALYPDKQERCFQEVNDIILDDLSNLDINILSKLKFLECFLKETQRLYPSVPSILRECDQDTALSNNLLLPKGTQIAVHIFDVQRNPKYFENPNDFIPERFENGEQRHSHAFVPFSAGQRNCIGQKFAMLEMKTVLVYILKNFKILPVTDPKDFRFSAGILIRSTSDVKVQFLKRKQKL